MAAPESAPMPTMITVRIFGSMRPAFGGAESLEMEASTIRSLLTSLDASYPAFKTLRKTGIAVAVNGTIYRDNRDVPLQAGDDIMLMPRIAGG